MHHTFKMDAKRTNLISMRERKNRWLEVRSFLVPILSSFLSLLAQAHDMKDWRTCTDWNQSNIDSCWYSLSEIFITLNRKQGQPFHVAVMGCYSTQSELARHDSRAHVQQLTIFSTTPACFARHATRDVDIIFPLTSSLKHTMNKQKRNKIII